MCWGRRGRKSRPTCDLRPSWACQHSYWALLLPPLRSTVSPFAGHSADPDTKPATRMASPRAGLSYLRHLQLFTGELTLG